MTEYGFQPAWTSPPGDTITDILRRTGMTTNDLAEQLDITAKLAKKLLTGEIEISEDLAAQLYATIGGSTEFWLRREQMYRETTIRLAEEKEWLKEIPWREMVRLGWIEAAKFKSQVVSLCLDYFNVPNIQAWQKQYSGIAQAAAYRSSNTYASADGSVAAWLRQGEIVAESIECDVFDSEKFRRELIEIRVLSREKAPEIFLTELTKRCGECGVAFVVVRAPSGCRHSGVTRFLSEQKALLSLSFRYLSDDHFWFTFFHEAGHLLLHSKELLFVEGPNTIATKEERDADEFSAQILIPAEFKAEFLGLSDNERRVVRFARKIGIAPGIVVGQLQHFGLIRRNQLNHLKRRFRWSD
jgi:HTH-type transcriptional regulator / antitoxin HigA